MEIDGVSGTPHRQGRPNMVSEDYDEQRSYIKTRRNSLSVMLMLTFQHCGLQVCEELDRYTPSRNHSLLRISNRFSLSRNF